MKKGAIWLTFVIEEIKVLIQEMQYVVFINHLYLLLQVIIFYPESQLLYISIYHYVWVQKMYLF